jgi:hypothetical protein
MPRVPALALALLFGALPASGLTRVGSLSGLHDSRDVAVAGNRVYWVETVSGLHVADASDPRAPREIGALDTPGFAVDVEVVGDVAFVADDASLQIIDVSDPTSPVALSAFTPPGAPEVNDVEVVGSRAYLSVGEFGFHIVDVTDPSAPVGIGALDTPGVVRDVAVRGDTAYLADLWGGLRILDVSDPAAPVELGHVPGGDVEAVAVVGGIALVEDFEQLRVIDVADGRAPRQIGVLELPEDANVVDIEVEGKLAFLVTSFSGLLVADLSDPRAPRSLGSLLTLQVMSDIELANGRGYVADASGFTVIDVSEPAYPSGVGGLATGDLFDNAEGVAVSDGIALVGQNAFVRVVDVSDPSTPIELARIGGLGSGPTADALLGDFAYVRGESGLHIFDLSDPSRPIRVGQHPKSASALEVKGGFAYAVGAEDAALDVIDVSNPSSPTTLGTLRGFLFPWDVAVAGGIAHVGDDSRLRLVDVSDPRAPVEIGSLGLRGDAYRVAVLGTRAFVVSQLGSFPERGRLTVIDVSDPTAPRELTAVLLPETPHDVEVLPGRVFVGENDGIRVFSLSMDDVLTELGAFATDVAWDLELAGGLVHAACEQDGLRIVDFGPEYGQLAAIDVARHPGKRLPPRSRGRVTVALRGSEFLDASVVDPSTLRFGPGEARPRGRNELRDGDRDGFLDLLARFRWRDTEIGRGTETACLHGRLLDGARFLGCDAIETPPVRASPPRARKR